MLSLTKKDQMGLNQMSVQQLSLEELDMIAGAEGTVTTVTTCTIDNYKITGCTETTKAD